MIVGSCVVPPGARPASDHFKAFASLNRRERGAGVMPAIFAVVFHFDSDRAGHRGAEFAEEGSRRKRTGGPRRRLIRLCPPDRLRAFLSELRADAAGDF